MYLITDFDQRKKTSIFIEGFCVYFSDVELLHLLSLEHFEVQNQHREMDYCSHKANGELGISWPVTVYVLNWCSPF
jgi:hypothetical protein